MSRINEARLVRERANLAIALIKCLQMLNDYYGLTEDEEADLIRAAMDDPNNWSPYVKNQNLA